MKKNTDSAEGMFRGIATHIDTTTDIVTEKDMDKNYQGLRLGGFDPLEQVITDQLPLESAKIGLESVLIKIN